MNGIYIGIGILLLLGIHTLHQKRTRNNVIRVVQNKCTGCGQCVSRCPHKVLEMKEDENSKKYVTVKSPLLCTACGDCIKKCKFNALELVKRI